MSDNSCIRVLANHAQIKECREKIEINSDSFSRLGKLLDLSGSEVRLKILYLLEEEDELCPCDISDILGMSVPAVSQHLRKLRDGNVIESRRDGQTIFYSLCDEHLKILRPFFKYINSQNLRTENA